MAPRKMRQTTFALRVSIGTGEIVCVVCLHLIRVPAAGTISQTLNLALQMISSVVDLLEIIEPCRITSKADSTSGQALQTVQISKDWNTLRKRSPTESYTLVENITSSGTARSFGLKVTVVPLLGRVAGARQITTPRQSHKESCAPHTFHLMLCKMA